MPVYKGCVYRAKEDADEVVIYEFSEDGLELVDGAFYIPETIEGKPVVEIIYSSSINLIYEVKRAIVPRGVKKIGYNAFFQFDCLERVEIPASVELIEPEFFGNLPELQSIHVDEKNPNYSSVGGVLFDKNQKTLLLFPQAKKDAETYVVLDGVETIVPEAFARARYLKKIVIPKSVTTIGKDAFKQNEFLDSVQVDEKNPNYLSVGGVLFDREKRTLISFPKGKLSIRDEYVVPEGVETIEAFAFSFAANKPFTIVLPRSLKSFNADSFSMLMRVNFRVYRGGVAHRALEELCGKRLNQICQFVEDQDPKIDSDGDDSYRAS